MPLLIELFSSGLVEKSMELYEMTGNEILTLELVRILEKKVKQNLKRQFHNLMKNFSYLKYHITKLNDGGLKGFSLLINSD